MFDIQFLFRSRLANAWPGFSPFHTDTCSVTESNEDEDAGLRAVGWLVAGQWIAAGQNKRSSLSLLEFFHTISNVNPKTMKLIYSHA